MELIFDSHAHYDSDQFDEDRHEVLTGLRERGVGLVLNCGSNLLTSEQSIALSTAYDFIYASVGLHPHEADYMNPKLLAALEHLAVSHPKVVAIGECGLDYHYDFAPHGIQMEAFAAQLALAERLKKPIIIHSREATADTLSLLESYNGTGVVHCYSGSVETMNVMLSKGLYIGFTGVVTFKNARRTIEVVEAVPLDRLLVETDAPYMAPEPSRGRRCDSGMLAYTVARIAEIKGISPARLIAATAENARRLFGIAP